MTDAQISEIEKKMHEIYLRIAQLDAHQGETIEFYCTYDKATKQTGGQGGQFINQCKNPAIEGTTPPLCHTHARKNLLDLIVEGQAQIMKLKKQPMRSRVESANIIDPKTVLVTAAEYEEFKKNKGTCMAEVKDIEGGVHGRSAAICKAMVLNGFK